MGKNLLIAILFRETKEVNFSNNNKDDGDKFNRFLIFYGFAFY